MFTTTDLPILQLSDKKRENEITKIITPLIVDEDRQGRIKSAFIEEIGLGLSANPERPSSLQMENTFIPELTNGTEEGDYLAIDLGSTNFRVMIVHIVKGVVEKEEVVYYDIPKDVFQAEGTKLFDFLASSIEDFLQKRNIAGRHYNLGFTFSFPMVHTRINSAILTKWTKSFNCPNVEGRDVVQLLNEAIKRVTKLDITITTVLNDTAGTLVQGSQIDKRCAMAMILGTGNNGCYMEKVSNIPKWKGKHDEEQVIIDIEWGAFGDNGVLDFLRTKWDDAIDAKSLLPKSFTFEKYVGGKFLGDIVRETLYSLATEELFCRGQSKVLATPGVFKTSFVTEIEKEAFGGCVSRTKEILTSMGMTDATDEDARITQFVCGLITYRACLLVSILSSVLVERMNRSHCTIAIDGSLFEHHPRFKPLMQKLITGFVPDKSLSLLLAKDGSGKGAGLVAAIENRLRASKQNKV